MINNIFKPVEYLSSDHPFNRYDAEHPRPNIPDAIVYEIFKYLPVQDTCRVLTMCKSKMGEERFGALRKALALKRELTFNEFKEYQRIFSAEFQSEKNETPTMIQLVQEGYFPSLENFTSLDLSEAYDMTDEELIALATLCPNITSIKIGNENLSSQNITEHGIQMLGQLCPNLTSLELRSRFEIHQLDLKNFPNLTSIMIDGIPIRDEDIQELAKNCPKLKSIFLTPCFISDISAQAIGEHYPELSSLTLLIGNENPDTVILDAGVQKLAEGCPKLTSIVLQGCAFITDDGIKALAKCPLSEVILSESGITDDGLKSLAENCPDLTTLCLPNSYQIQDAGMKEIANHCPKLSTINLSHTFITDETVQALGLCSKLAIMNLDSCNKITGSTFQVFEGLLELTFLNLDHCPLISDDGVRVLANHCPKLNDCYMYGSTLITRETAELFKQNHPNTTFLYPHSYD